MSKAKNEKKRKENSKRLISILGGNVHRAINFELTELKCRGSSIIDYHVRIVLGCF